MMAKKVVEKKRTYQSPRYETTDRVVSYNYENHYNGKCKSKKKEKGFHPQRRKKMFRNSPKKAFLGSPRKGKGVPKAGQKPIKCHRCDGWGHGWKECPTPENLNWRELVGL